MFQKKHRRESSQGILSGLDFNISDQLGENCFEDVLHSLIKWKKKWHLPSYLGNTGLTWPQATDAFPHGLAVKAFQCVPFLATRAALCLFMETGHLRKLGKTLDLSLFSFGSPQVQLMDDLFFLMFNLAIPLFLPLLIPESTLQMPVL